MSTVSDPLAHALDVVLRHGGKNHVARDDLTAARRVREVAQICWMYAGEPDRLRSEDADRAAVCHELARGWWHRRPDARTKGPHGLRLVTQDVRR